MNTKALFKISTYLLFAFISLAGFASCSEDETKGDSTVPALVSQNFADGVQIATGDSVIELNFSKAMRQAPETQITLDDEPQTVSINYEKVLCSFSGLADGTHTFKAPAKSLTDMDGRAFDQEISITFTVKAGIVGNIFNAVVDANGNGDYTTISEAINRAPNNQTKPYLIYVMNGTYNECLYISKVKPFIHLIGESRDGVKIQFAMNRSADPAEDGNVTQEQWAYSINNSSSPFSQRGYNPSSQRGVVTVEATDVLLSNLTILNLFGADTRYEGGMAMNGQAEALITRNDRTTLNNVKLVSFQDTYWIWNNADLLRTYITNSTIEGHTDYIWGGGDLYCENSTLYNVIYPGQGDKSCSYITQNRSRAGVDKYGHVFDNCVIDGNDIQFSFGRALTVGQVIFKNITLKQQLIDAHWTAGRYVPTLYGEYNIIDASGKDVAASVQFGTTAAETSTLLSKAEADTYNYDNIIKNKDGWDPKSMLTTPGKVSGITLNGSDLTWDKVDNAAGYLVFEDGKYVGQSSSNALPLDNANASATYTVKAVTKYGMVGE